MKYVISIGVEIFMILSLFSLPNCSFNFSPEESLFIIFFYDWHQRFSSWSKYKKYQYLILIGYSIINYQKDFEPDVLWCDMGTSKNLNFYKDSSSLLAPCLSRNSVVFKTQFLLEYYTQRTAKISPILVSQFHKLFRW